MFIPIGDYPNPPKPQWITRILIGINVVVYLFLNLSLEGKPVTEKDFRANRPVLVEILLRTNPKAVPTESALRAIASQMDRYHLLVVEKYGFKPAKPIWIALLLCMFLHAGFLHLAGNMLFLWIYGDNVEHRLGPIPYLIAYLGTGMVATYSFAVFNSGSTTPLVGASGAISGVLGFYLIWFPHNYVRVFLWIFVFVQVIHVRALFMLLFYLFIDNLLPLWVSSMQAGRGGGGVAYLAHLGGFVAGIVAGWLFNRVKGVPPRPQFGPQPLGARRETDPVQIRSIKDHTQDFVWAVEHSEMPQAAHSFAAIVREGGRVPEPKHVFVLGHWLYEQGYVQDAVAVFRYYLKSFPRGEDTDRVNLGLGVLMARKLGQPRAAKEYLLAAIDAAPQGDQVAEVARAELDRLEGGIDDDHPRQRRTFE